MRKIIIVVGLGFGDEGKGMTVNSLCSDPNNEMVIRMSGGQQCGHTVVTDKIRHVFSSFGSGTLKGVPTYWSEYCTVDPMSVIKEGNKLIEQGITPKIIYNANAMITTPFDVVQNIMVDLNKGHGTVGVGFGATIQRNESHYRLNVRDLYFSKIRDEKLKNILKYYGYTTPLNTKAQKFYDNFIEACDKFIKMYDFVENFAQLHTRDKKLIFEGGQGIMLDQDYGFFPNVTRSYTTSRNAMEFIINNLDSSDVETYYVTRAYQTRHGIGYMTNADLPISYIKINPNETNVDTGYQGTFRKSVLDLDLLKYALSCDKYYNSDWSPKKLVITCCDQVDEKKNKSDEYQIPLTKENKTLCLTPKEIGEELNVFKTIPCDSEKGFLLI